MSKRVIREKADSARTILVLGSFVRALMKRHGYTADEIVFTTEEMTSALNDEGSFETGRRENGDFVLTATPLAPEGYERGELPA